MSLFSDNIRFRREKKNVSQDELAKQLSVTRSSYAKYELALRNTLQGIAHTIKLLQIDP